METINVTEIFDASVTPHVLTRSELTLKTNPLFWGHEQKVWCNSFSSMLD
jgi:hypothetical protein